MDKTRIKHWVGLLSTISLPLLLVWGDSGSDLAAKILGSVPLLIPLIWADMAKRRQAVTYLLAAVPVAAILAAHVFARMSASATAGAAGAVVTAVLTRLPALLGTLAQQPAPAPTEVVK